MTERKFVRTFETDGGWTTNLYIDANGDDYFEMVWDESKATPDQIALRDEKDAYFKGAQDALLMGLEDAEKGVDKYTNSTDINAKIAELPFGTIAAWCAENDIPVVRKSDGSFYLNPQDENQRFLVRMRWH